MKYRFLMILLLLPLLGRAQSKNIYEAGAFFDPSVTPHFKGYASILVPVSDTTYSYSTVLINKPVKGVFTYSLVTGIDQKLPFMVAGFKLYTGAQGGMAVSQGATSGAFQGGLTETRPIKTGSLFQLAFKQSVYGAPTAGGFGFQMMAGIRFGP